MYPLLPPAAHDQSLTPKEAECLSVEQCRQLLGWTHATDEEIAQFLLSLRNMLGRFVDDAFHNEMVVDDPE